MYYIYIVYLICCENINDMHEITFFTLFKQKILNFSHHL